METSPTKVAFTASLPTLRENDSFDELIRKLASYITELVDKPISFEEFRTSQDSILTPLARYLLHDVHHPALVAALLALNGNFVALEEPDGQGIYAARGFACEAIASRHISGLSDRETIDSLLYELPSSDSTDTEDQTRFDTGRSSFAGSTEQSPLLPGASLRSRGSLRVQPPIPESEASFTDDGSEYADQFEGLNALEIAAVSGAKKFLCQKPVQRIINAIWTGDIVFWAKLSTDAKKRAQIYQRKNCDPYCRLRVPLYLKTFEVLFFMAFLAFYYVVLIQRSFYSVSTAEVMLYVWFVSFAYNEIGEFWDAGSTLWLTDFWSSFDICILATFLLFFIFRMVGLHTGNDKTIDTSFDILALEALFLIPRICSLLSLHQYYGVLMTCLTAMTKDFLKFLSLVAILYCGFLTTFIMLARGSISYQKMSLILLKIFLGSSYLGFDVAERVSPVLGLPLMVIFIILTQILLITSLISILSNSLSNVLSHAREEYVHVSSVYILESSASNRMTYFLPPFNIIGLALRPLRLVMSAEQLRYTRIMALKMTHLPHVLLINLYERVRAVRKKDSSGLGFGSPRGTEKPPGWKGAPLKKRLSARYPVLPPNLRPVSSLGSERLRDASSSDRQTSTADLRDVKSVLDQLTAQVEHLRWVVEQQERNLQTSDD